MGWDPNSKILLYIHEEMKNTMNKVTNKGINFLPQSLIFLFLYLCNPMS